MLKQAIRAAESSAPISSFWLAPSALESVICSATELYGSGMSLRTASWKCASRR